MSKLFFYDLETTGINPSINGIHQISGMIIIDNKIRERFNFKVKPYENSRFDESALKVGNVTEAQINNYPTRYQVFPELIEILSKYVNKFDRTDKFHLAGFRIDSFDNLFFRKFFEQNGDTFFNSWFWSDSIDISSLASFHLQDERSKMVNFKLFSVAEKLGIQVDKTQLHDAEYDVWLTVQIYYKIQQSPTN